MNGNPDIEKRKQKRKRRKNIILAVVIFALIVSTSCTLYMNIDNPLLHNVFSGFGLDIMTDGNTVDFDKTEKYAIAGCDGDAIISRSNQTLCLDSNMNVLWSMDDNNTFPVVKSKGKYAIKYNFDGENAYIIKNGKTVELLTGNPVIGGTVNENGYSAVITREKGYKSQVIVFSDEGEVLYKWHSADSYITDATISPDNRTLAVAAIDFSTNTTSGELMFFNFYQEKPYAGKILENNMVLQLEFTDKNSLLVVGDSAAIVYNATGEAKAEYAYDGKKLFNYDICPDGSLVLAVSDSDSVMTGTQIKILSKKLKEKGTYSSGGSVTSIDAADGSVLLVSDRTLSVISSRGNEIKKLDINKDVKDAILFGNGKDALITAGSMAEIVNLK